MGLELLPFAAYICVWGVVRRMQSCAQRKQAAATSLAGTVEICLSDINSACIACKAGATSIELCCDRAGGGVTPSIGLISSCVKRLGGKIQIHVLIRPRVGDFVYNEEEMAVILADIQAAKAAGADGVVVGVLDISGNVDIDQLNRIRTESEGMLLTFHRAIDVCSSYLEALEMIINCGCDRVLTSGQQRSALKGLPNLSKIILGAADRIAVIAAAGINADNADIIVSGTGVHGVHAGSSLMSVASHDINFTAGTATMGNSRSSNDDMKWEEVDVEKTERYVQNANKGFSIYQKNKICLPPPLHTGGADDDADVYPTYF